MHVASQDDIDRLASLLTGNAVGLMLSGGGARGFAHIGVIKALREAGIVIDLCGGTSIGSIMAAGLAAGWNNEQMVERFRRTFVERNPIGDYTLPLISLAAGKRVSRLLRGEIGDIDIEDLARSFFCISTDLVSASMVVHRTGPLWRCLRGSVAIPGILPPVFHKQQILVDGGLINHLPVDIMRGLARGRVIGVDVGSKTPLAACDDVDELSVLAWRAFDRAIEAGYRSTMERMDEIQVAIQGQRKTEPPSALERAGIVRSNSYGNRVPRTRPEPRHPPLLHALGRAKNWLTSLLGRPDSA